MGHYTFYLYEVDAQAEKNLLTRILRPKDGLTRYSAGMSEAEMQAKFLVTAYQYYAVGTYPVKGLLQAEIDPNGHSTTYTYDHTYCNLATKTDPESSPENPIVTHYEYDALGLLRAETSPEGHRTEYAYDENGQLLRMISAAGQGNYTTRLVYNSLGQLIQEIAPQQYESSKDLETTYADPQAGVRYTYYPHGKVKTEQDAENYLTAYSYDGFGNLTREIKPNGAVYSYTYDQVNRLQNVYFQETAESPQILLETYRYAIITGGCTTKTQTTYFTAEDQAVTVFTYDSEGRLLSQRKPDNTTLSLYNKFRLIKATYNPLLAK